MIDYVIHSVGDSADDMTLAEPDECPCYYYLRTKDSKKDHSVDEQHSRPAHHFLLVVRPDGIAVFAMEVLAYRFKTAYILYVSKVDSTGFATGVSSLRYIVAAMLKEIASQYAGYGRRIFITLFARAHPHYLFPASGTNGVKRVLDDHQLVKWWLGCLNPIVDQVKEAKAVVYMPAIDVSQHIHYMPSEHWRFGKPFEDELGPIHSIIPRFPDDPKGRFLDVLLDQKDGRSTTMAEFWEQMAFRQECTSGRLVGFVTLSGLFPASKDDDQVHGRLVSNKDYRKLHEDLIRGDYCSQKLSLKSTQSWLQSVNTILKDSDEAWGRDFLHIGDAVEKRKRAAEIVIEQASSRERENQTVNTLAARKKPKT